MILELKKKPNYVAIVTVGARGTGRDVVKSLMQCDMHVVIGEYRHSSFTTSTRRVFRGLIFFFVMVLVR